VPQGVARPMILGRPLMKRVVTRHIQERNNDVAIALLNPLSGHHINFEDICNVIDDFLIV
jgi:hypothetical protein